MSNLTHEQVQAFLYREARLLDDRQWDDWLACYHPDVEFWMPSWDDDDQLTTDPQREISLIYYPSRAGLEDRVFRIKTERSAASMPEPIIAFSRMPTMSRRPRARTSVGAWASIAGVMPQVIRSRSICRAD